MPESLVNAQPIEPFARVKGAYLRQVQCLHSREVFNETDEELAFLHRERRSLLPSLTSNKPCWVRKEKAGLTIVFPTADELKESIFQAHERADSIGFFLTIIENHDEPRGVSHYIAEGQVNDTSKKLWELFKSCVREFLFIYQGQEIGMETKSLNRWRTLMISRPSMATTSLKKLV